MPLRAFIIVTIIFLFLIPGTLFAQQNEDSSLKKEDTVILKNNKADNSGKALLAEDTTSKKFNPKVAVLRSAILPGWGQWYNKKYWKIPIIYGALGTTTGVFFYNLKIYRLLRLAVIYRSDTDTTNDHLIAPEFQSLPTDFLRQNRNVFRQNIDYSVLVFLLFWGLNVVDASVDAHLKAFDVSPDISMRLQPSFENNSGSPGISLVFFFKEKNTKPTLPLP